MSGYEPDRYLVLYDYADYVQVKEQRKKSGKPCYSFFVKTHDFAYKKKAPIL